MKRLITIAAIFFLINLSGCGGGPGVQIPDGANTETLIYSTSAERPAWTMDEPDTVDGIMSFVGVSNRYATEKGAREDARRNAMDAVVKWMGTMVKNKFEQLSVSFGAATSVVDPAQSAKEYEKQLAANMASRVKIKTWYMEKWQTPTGIGYQVFALGHVPKNVADDTLKDMAKRKAQEAQDRARDAADTKAQTQATKAAEFWKQMQEQGVVNE